jgi:2-hydroxy-3-keto-5-methylthiopentenyl-1-phosphate phosphatase
MNKILKNTIHIDPHMKKIIKYSKNQKTINLLHISSLMNPNNNIICLDFDNIYIYIYLYN